MNAIIPDVKTVSITEPGYPPVTVKYKPLTWGTRRILYQATEGDMYDSVVKFLVASIVEWDLKKIVDGKEVSIDPHDKEAYDAMEPWFIERLGKIVRGEVKKQGKATTEEEEKN